MPVIRGRSDSSAGGAANDAGCSARQSRRELTAEIEEAMGLAEGCMAGDFIASCWGDSDVRATTAHPGGLYHCFSGGPEGKTNARHMWRLAPRMRRIDLMSSA